MIIFLYGQDTFRSLRKLEQIIEGYKKKNKQGVNLQYLDLEEEDFQSFRDRLRSRSMFEEKRLFVLKNPFSNSEFKKKLLQNKKLLSTSHLVVFHQRGKPKKKDPLFKFLEKEAKTQRFAPLKGGRLKAWVKEEARKRHAEMSPSALSLLLKRTGSDLWRLHNEISRIASWKGGSEKNEVRITKEEVKRLTSPRLEKDIFKTIDAIAARKKNRALSLIHSHLEKGDSPIYILSMIAWQFSRLLAVKEKDRKGERVYDLDWHPYVIKKSLRLSKKFEFQELKEIYDRIADIDWRIKTGRIEPELGLEFLIAKV